MNLLLVSLGLRVWRGSPIQVVTGVLAAVSIVSVEVQFATWSGLGTLRTLIPVSAMLAVVLFAATSHGRVFERTGWKQHAGSLVPAVAGLALVVTILNITLPLTPVDPYHFERVATIERLGTIAYDPSVDRNDPRLNVLNWLYEYLLADIKQVPVAGAGLLRLHGVLGLTLYAAAAWSMLLLVGASSGWPAVMLFAVPLVFQQFVLVKNDLFGAVPAMLALAWAVKRQREAPALEFLWAGWLTGLAVAVKLTTFPVAVVLAIGTLHRKDLRAAAALVAGGALGALSGGLVFTLVENVRMYGDPLAPLMAVNGRPTSLVDAAVSVLRFAISIFDMGVLTRALWPRIGGWGGTYGLPVIWAIAVLVTTVRVPASRRALWMVSAIWLMSAASNIDMSANHRYVLAPGLVLITVAVARAGEPGVLSPWLRRSAVPVMVLSALQMARSAILYLVRL